MNIRQIEKSDGNGNLMLVDDPDQFNDEGEWSKIRKKKPSSTTPKKKKRKKTKKTHRK